MKLLELTVEHLSGVPDGTYSFTEADGAPSEVVILACDGAGALLQTIAAVMEAVEPHAPAPHQLDWWAGRRGVMAARLRARWALSACEAARAGLAVQAAVSEWRFGHGDRPPRELQVEGAPSPHSRADLGRYVFVDAKRISVWMEADPLAELLAGIARRDITATRACCHVGVGTPDVFPALNRAIAGVFPALRIERVACAPGELPVACYRSGERTELDQLPDVERDAIHFAAMSLTGSVRDGVVLVDRPELHVPREARAPWLRWLAGLVGTNQLFAALGGA